MFTPGPWFISKGIPGAIISESVAVGKVIAMEVWNGGDQNLIAAAPELYEAMRDLLKANEDDDIDAYFNALEKGEAAFAKANGESNA